MEEQRPVYKIANDIAMHWQIEGFDHYAARPYLNAMQHMTKVSDRFGHDDGEGIILRFLDNARTWRGTFARQYKAELRALLKK